jgi:hypothetical protein
VQAAKAAVEARRLSGVAANKAAANKAAAEALQAKINDLKVTTPNNNTTLKAMVDEIERVTAKLEAIKTLKAANSFNNKALGNNGSAKLTQVNQDLTALKAAAQAKAQTEINAIKSKLNSTFKASNAVLNNKSKKQTDVNAAVASAAKAVLEALRVPQRNLYKKTGVAMNLNSYQKNVDKMKAKAANFNKFRIIGARDIPADFNYSAAAKQYVNTHGNNAGRAQEQINRKRAKGIIGWRNKNLNAFWKAVNAIKNFESKRAAAAAPKAAAHRIPGFGAASSSVSRRAALAAAAATPPPTAAPAS